MIATKRVSIVATIALALAMAAAPAYAANPCSPTKNKAKGCKNEIKGCIGAFDKCKGAKGKAKKICQRNCKTAVVAACTATPPASNSVCTASPSGAFLEL